MRLRAARSANTGNDARRVLMFKPSYLVGHHEKEAAEGS